MIVVDANLLVGLLIPGPGSAAATRVFALDPDWLAPLLLRSEFRNVLSVQIRRRAFDLTLALEAMAEAGKILDGNEFDVDSAEVLALSARSGCSAYDCEYAALALALRLPLVTWDKALLAAFPKTALAPEKFIREAK